MTKKGFGMSPEQRREYMKKYMRERRAGTLVRKAPSPMPKTWRIERAIASRQPPLTQPLVYDSLTAQLLGDPPIGRRAIDR